MRRRAASLTYERQPVLSDDDLEKMMAHLAYRIRDINRTGTIESEQAAKEIEDYLKAPNGDFGFTQYQARLYSRTVLDVGENTIGLLVKQSPKELGFFHRALWEYLCSYHLSRLALTQQKEFIEKSCIDPQAHELILGLLQISNRSQDVRELVCCLQAKLEHLQPVDQFAVKLLLSEIAFGEFNCPANLAKEIAADAFEEIELGFWMPYRERLLKNVLNGLRSTPLKETVKAKLQTWFPCRQKWRENLFQAISHWSPTPETIEILWRGLHDEEFGNKRAAAKSLAAIAQGDVQIADRHIICGGIDLDERRQAAFSGLVVLNRLDIIVNAKEHNKEPCQIPVIHPLYINSPLLKLILENWQSIKTAFGEDLWSRLTKDTQNYSTLWIQLSLFADEYPVPCNELLEFLNSQTDRLTDINILRFLGRTRPKSSLLLEYCLDTLTGRSGEYSSLGEKMLVAAELLGENFGGDLTVLERILSNVRQDFFPPCWVITALAEGWHDREEFGRIFEQVFREGFEDILQEVIELHHAGYFALVCRKGTPDLMFNVLMQVFQQANTWMYIRDRSLIIRRLQTDEQFLEMLNNHLRRNPTVTERITILKLIARAKGISPELKNWCLDEVNAQVRSNSPPLTGIDLIAGGIRPLTHSLLDVLLGDSTSKVM